MNDNFMIYKHDYIINHSAVCGLIKDIKIIESKDYNRYISINWLILCPKQYLNFYINQKVKVWDDNDTRAIKAMKMLKDIDRILDGKLASAGPITTEKLRDALLGKHCLLWVELFETDTGKYNWISKVEPIDTYCKVDTSQFIDENGKFIEGSNFIAEK